MPYGDSKAGEVGPGKVGTDAPITAGDQRLVCGDCLTVMAGWPSGVVDLVVTSPPYNLDLVYGAYQDSRAEGDYIAWLAACMAAVRRVLKPGGSIFLNIAGSNSRPYLPFLALVRLREAGFHLQNHITWIKSIGIGSDSTGHFKPIGGRRFLHHNHEHIFHLTLRNDVVLDRLAIGVPFQDKSNIARRGHARDLRCRGNTWFLPYQTVKSRAQKYWHPATFPVELPLWCIYLHGRPQPTVLDPFLGTGTTLLAAHYAGARGIGIDIDPAYIDTAHRRLGDAVAQVTRVRLGRDEVGSLLQPAARSPAIVRLQQRLNKTDGTLPLTPDDRAWIARHAAQPAETAEQRVAAALARHVART